MFAYDSASDQLVIFPPAVPQAIAIQLQRLRDAGWIIDAAWCRANLPRADRKTGQIEVASAADLRRLTRH
jgi:hypothetical protein